VLDPLGEILAQFYSADTSPKRVARFRGLDLLHEGHEAEAEGELLRALREPLGTPTASPAMPWMIDADAERRREDALVRLTLARLFLDQGRDDEAEAQLQEADRLLEDKPWELRMLRDSLWARLDLRRDRYQQVYKRLRQTMGIAAPDRAGPRWQDSSVQYRLQSEGWAMTEAYALLAVAARETDRRNDFEWALAAAKERGVDVSLLE
jgi:hypothetical protein